MTFSDLPWFLVAIFLLVTVHEFGHYWVARLVGIKVLRFSIGFGPPLWSFKAGRDQTEYAIAPIPLGGYVSMLGEQGDDVPVAERARSFSGRPPWQRILVLLAGPAFNFAFAILLLWALFWSSGETQVRAVIATVQPDSVAARAGLVVGDIIEQVDGKRVTAGSELAFALLDAVTGDGRAVLQVHSRGAAPRELQFSIDSPLERRRLSEPEALFLGLGFALARPRQPAVVDRIEPAGPADRAGLRAGDEIVAVAGERVAGFVEARDRIRALPGQSVVITYVRNGARGSARVEVETDRSVEPPAGRIGIQGGELSCPHEMLICTDLGPAAALGRSVTEAWKLTVLQAKFIWRMVTGSVSLKNLSGPLSIADFAGDSAQAGAGTFVYFLVLISLSLGFLNLLPIPILDGGNIVFALAEWLRGAPLSERALLVGRGVGLVMLALMISAALFNDVARLVG